MLKKLKMTPILGVSGRVSLISTMKVTAALLLSAAALANAVQLEIKPFKRLIPADVLRGGNHLYLDIYSDLANICHLPSAVAFPCLSPDQ